jgi:putative membrane protein insertion efficiency factor
VGKSIFILVVSGYRTFLSPFLPRSCRFFPSCSDYAEQAIERCGVKRGLRLTLKRLLHCHPNNPGGYDPVP